MAEVLTTRNFPRTSSTSARNPPPAANSRSMPATLGGRFEPRSRDSRAEELHHTTMEGSSTDTGPAWLLIPGLKGNLKRYYTVEIKPWQCDPDLCIERGDVIKQAMQSIISKSPDLSNRPGEFVYHLEMVGSTLEDAHPSIVIECDDRYAKSLKKLFKKNSVYTLLAQGSVPPHSFYIYRTKGNPVVRKAADEILEARFKTDLTWCGGMLHYQERAATLGLTIAFGPSYGVVTVNHLFRPEVSTQDTPEDASSSWSSDSEYDELDYDACQDKKKSMSKLAGRMPEPAEIWTKLEAEQELDSSEPYLDWALAVPNDRKKLPVRINGYHHPMDDSTFVLLDKLAEEPRSNLVPVHMISGVQGVLAGKILKNPAMMGSAKSERLQRSWVLILDDEYSTENGDCGSVVADQRTHEVYGHLVGASPNGHGYVVPVQDILQQVKTCFKEEAKIGPPAKVNHNTAIMENPTLAKMVIKSLQVPPSPLPRDIATDSSSYQLLSENVILNDDIVARFSDKNSAILLRTITAPEKLSLPSETMIEAIAACLEDPDLNIRFQALVSLEQQFSISSSIVSSLAALIVDEVVNESIRIGALHTLSGSYLHFDSVAAVVKVLLKGKKDELEIQEAALDEAIIRPPSRSDDMATIILTLSRDRFEDWWMRASIVDMLVDQRLSSNLLKTAVAQRINGKREYIILWTLIMFERSKSLVSTDTARVNSVIAAFIAVPKDQDLRSSDRRRAKEPLSREFILPDLATTTFVARLADRSTSRFIRLEAIRELSKREVLQGTVFPAILAGLSDDDWQIRAAAIDALGKRPPLSEWVANAIADRFSDSRIEVREAAVNTLALQFPVSDSVINALVARLDDDDKLVRDMALIALARYLKHS